VKVSKQFDWERKVLLQLEQLYYFGGFSFEEYFAAYPEINL
jgi:hypothetical protein